MEVWMIARVGMVNIIRPAFYPTWRLAIMLGLITRRTSELYVAEDMMTSTLYRKAMVELEVSDDAIGTIDASVVLSVTQYVQ